MDDARSGERGQYVFLQALLRQVALGTLSRRDRKARHLAVARQIQEASGDETVEIAEVLAAHYLAAVEADPDAEDAPAIRASACETLADAGRRALSLALGPEARRHFERAAELAEGPAAQGRLLREAGMAAQLSGEMEDALPLLERSRDLLQEAGLERDSHSVEGAAGYVLQVLRRGGEARERLTRAYAAVNDGTDDEVVAELASALSSINFMEGYTDEALTLADEALRIADGLRIREVVVRALVSKGNALAETGRPEESTALLTHAVQLAQELDLTTEVISGYFNLADNLMAQSRFAEAQELLERGLTLARQRGDRVGERRLLAQEVLAMIALGNWDKALDAIDMVRGGAQDIWAAQAFVLLPYVLSPRGELDALQALFDELGSSFGWPDVEGQARLGRAMILRDTTAGR